MGRTVALADMGVIVTTSERELRMRPGSCSQLGFLGEGESLEAVIEQDRRSLAQMGITHDQVADALEGLVRSVKEQRDHLLSIAEGPEAEFFRREDAPWPDLYNPESIPRFSSTSLPDADRGYLVDRHHVFVTQYRGLQECPWGCDLGHDTDSSLDLLVVNRDTADSFTCPGLAAHLIRCHHFFEGVGTPFRTDPAKVARVLGLGAHPPVTRAPPPRTPTAAR